MNFSRWRCTILNKVADFFCQTLNSLNRFWANSFSISAVVDRNWKTHLYKCSVVPIRWAVFLNGQIIDILSRQGKECRGAWSSDSKPDCVGIFAPTLVVQRVFYCRVVLRLKYFGIVAQLARSKYSYCRVSHTRMGRATWQLKKEGLLQQSGASNQSLIEKQLNHLHNLDPNFRLCEFLQK